MSVRARPPAAAIESARSFLYVPGDDARKLASAGGSAADAVVADLEDAVAPARKSVARREVERFVGARTGGPPLLVRVNPVSSDLIRDDLNLVRAMPLAGIVIPKAHAGELDALDLGGLPIVAMIEDARGVRDAYEVACHPDVVRLGLGGVDLAAELGLRSCSDGLELLHVRSRLVIDSAAAGLAAPIDSPYLQFADQISLRCESELVRSLGFGGKACIHPSQIDVVARAFAPSSEEVEWATAVVGAYERGLASGHGAVSHDGAMIDAPVVARARALLTQARKEA